MTGKLPHTEVIKAIPTAGSLEDRQFHLMGTNEWGGEKLICVFIDPKLERTCSLSKQGSCVRSREKARKEFQKL